MSDTSQQPFNLDDLPTNPQTPSITDEFQAQEEDVSKLLADYQDRFVAFVDILGFTELVQRSATDPSLLNQISQAFVIGRRSSNSDSDLRMHTFSDFVVLSAPNSREGLEVLLLETWSLIKDWLSKGFLSRGGIALGKIVHEVSGQTPVVFGPAFLAAYRIEQEVADVPRVVFSRSAREKLENFKLTFYQRVDSQNQNRQELTKLVYRCDDGPLCIDIFAHLRREGFDLGTSVIDEALQFRNGLCKNISSTVDTPKHYRKVNWLVSRFNEAIRSIPENKALEILNP